MPQHAMQVEPVISDNDGSVQGFQIHGTTKHSNATFNEQDFIEQSDGTFRHIYQDQVTNNDPKMFEWSDYLSTFTQAHPQLMDAIKFAETTPLGLPEDFGEAFNNAIQNEDLDTFNLLSEQLLELYDQAVEQDEPEFDQQLQDQEWFDQLPQADLENEIADLEAKQFSFQDAELMAEVGANYESDSVERAILMAGIDLAFGKTDLQTEINQITQKFGEATAVAAYYRLMESQV